MIKGIPIILYEKTKRGEDPFHKPIYEEAPVIVENVLIAPAQETEVLDILDLEGRKAIYTLAIPKGDDHYWENVTVEFFGYKWKTIGIPIQGIDAMIPLAWNKKVRCERYGESQTKSEDHYTLDSSGYYVMDSGNRPTSDSGG